MTSATDAHSKRPHKEYRTPGTKVHWFWNLDMMVAIPTKEAPIMKGTGKRFPPLLEDRVVLMVCSIVPLVVLLLVELLVELFVELLVELLVELSVVLV